MARPKSGAPTKLHLNLTVTEQTKAELTYIAAANHQSISELIAGICKPGSPKDRQTHRDNHAGHRTAHPSLILEKKNQLLERRGCRGTPCKKPSSSRYQRRRFLPYNGKATPGADCLISFRWQRNPGRQKEMAAVK